LEGLLGYLYVSLFDAQARHLWAADTALELLQPEVVVVGNDRWWGGQTFVQLARRRGIPSVCVQDGVAGENACWWWLSADRLAAAGAQLVEMLVRHGVPPERCRVTGQPRYDVLTRSGPDDQRTARAALGLDPSTFAVLFAAQSMHGPDYAWGVVSALLAVPGIHVILRPHPSDPSDLWERLRREHGSERVTLHRTGDSLTLVRACDALVTQHSTIVLEAALLGKPVVTAEFGGLHGPTRVIPGVVATQVRGLEELTREVQRLATEVHTARPKPSQSRQAALEAMVGPVDGRAGERVAELVAEVLQRVPCAVPAVATR
jgi:UDP-N-acetylglucosamine 2-epimerase